MKKISHKLILGMLLVTVLSVGLLWIYQAAFLEKNYMDSRVELLKKSTDELFDLYRNDIDGFVEYTEIIFIDQNISTELSLIDGSVLYSSGGNTMGKGHRQGFRVLKGAYLEELISTGEATTISSHQRQNMEMFTYSRLLNDSETVITTSLPIEPINETIDILQRQLIIISLILIVVSILIGTFFSKFFIDPIRKLNKSVNALASGNMDARVDVNTKDEIGELAVNFNRMAEEISKVDKLRKDLVANVSHELRTPLGLIRGYAEMSKDIHRDNLQSREENLDIIIEESERLSNMVDEILDLSKIQSGNMEFWYEEVDLVEIAKSAVIKYSIAAEEKGIDLSIKESKDRFMVWVDRKRIGQVFHNLISNAITNTEKGDVEILLTDKDDILRVNIKDTGRGIAADKIENIWDRYYKINNSDRKYGGSGIGLSITKAIFEAHDIVYGVESTLGEGTNFFFEIPIIK